MGKNNKKFVLDEQLKDYIQNQKVPILILDSRWHDLFPDKKKTFMIKRLEQEVHRLMKKQAKLIQDRKQLKVIKSKLMNEIVENMNSSENDAVHEKKQRKHHDLIHEINQKSAQLEEELAHLPDVIRQANERLLLESMKICYKELETNRKQIDEISEWIETVRKQLTNQVIKKQEMESENEAIYSYMHDLLGARMIDLFDHKSQT